jgi:hypothetical protein
MSFLLPQRVEAFSQSLAGSVETNLGCRFGDSQLLGDRLVGKVVDVTQDDNCPELRWQLDQGLGQLGPEDTEIGPDHRIPIWMFVRNFEFFGQGFVALPDFSSQVGAGAVGRDAMEPG